MRFSDVILVTSLLLNIVLVGTIYVGLDNPKYRDILTRTLKANQPLPKVVSTPAESPVINPAAKNRSKSSYTSTTTHNGETVTKVYNQYFDADEAFAKDELFAVTGKKIIPAKHYTDHFDKSSFGNPKDKLLPAIYIIRCMGRETR